MTPPQISADPSTESSRQAANRFAPRLVPTIAALVMMVLTFSLGQWQTRRAAEKNALETQADTRGRDLPVALPSAITPAQDLDLRRITVRGQFVAGSTIYLDNKVHNRQAGYHVLTGFMPEGGQALLLVNRGWVATGMNRNTLPAVTTPTGLIDLRGVARVFPKAIYELQSDDTARAAGGSMAWQNITQARAEAHLQRPLHTVLLQQEDSPGGSADGLTRAWPPATAQVGLGSDKHRGYAFQWYALSALLLVLWLTFSFRRVFAAHEPAR